MIEPTTSVALTFADLLGDPEVNALAEDYGHFRVAERLLLTGHSHQAWPDCARDAHTQAFDDAAAGVDRKWTRAFELADRVRRGFARLLDDDGAEVEVGTYALGANTHELVIRFLSALPLVERPRLVTTDGEFHTLRRQLARLEETGIEVVRLAADDPDTLAARVADAIDQRTAAVLMSTVLFASGRIVPGLEAVAEASLLHGAELLLDTYHQLGALPMSLHGAGLGSAFVVGGGYKYCQLGEGNCFLRVPAGRRDRPVITGWFAEFEALACMPGTEVAYGPGAAAYAGATYDPVSHYRAAAVFDFFARRGLTPELLRQVSQHQVGRLIRGFDALDFDPRLIDRPRCPLDRLGGFLVLETPHAETLQARLMERGVWVDHRGTSLRFGPAPYLSDRQLDDSMAALGESVQDL